MSASSNKNKMTFPASFSNVIGVKAHDSTSGRVGFRYNDNNIDRIDVNCYISNEIVKYNDKYYTLPYANSLAAPVISAKVCGLMNEGYDTLYKIKAILKEQSLATNHKLYRENYRKYFKEKINVPIIVMIIEGDINLLVQRLLSRFEDYGYSGICLSEKFETDIVMKVINLLEFNSYNVVEKIHFYSHYCDVDYVIVHMGDDNWLKSLKSIDIDVVIINQEYNKHVLKRRTKYINFHEHKDIDVLFSELYNYLSDN